MYVWVYVCVREESYTENKTALEAGQRTDRQTWLKILSCISITCES